MASTTFKGTVHRFKLKLEDRFVVDPQSIPANIRDALCQRYNYWLDSRIGPNHNVAHFDTLRQGWRDMRYAVKLDTYNDRDITYNDTDGTLHWA